MNDGSEDSIYMSKTAKRPARDLVLQYTPGPKSTLLFALDEFKPSIKSS